ncbi:chalcone isomerase family protein [Roseateles amylovorans]|uniref:Chalcone isomerase family protein n=1 Tax=Roseateles amylovorans TaxID=2978473 RepID=A0ABY6B350_9BURK|nr:chalcone isomerase family protein [Roseateles amylovorans]UXH79818.1 chalcone isomerase family protein [Roseateles amylovorans]
MNPIHFRSFLVCIGLATLSAIAGANEVDIEGYKFQDTATVLGQTLQLNGAATSSILSARSTAVGFYLPKKQTTMEGAVAEKGVKRIQFYMMRDVSARDLSNAMLDRIRQNAKEEFEKNIIQTAQLGVVFGTRPKLLKGDLVTLDYNPAKFTTEFAVNGQKVGDTIEGETFFPMMMKVWIGPKVRGSTRDGLLGAPVK